MGTEMGYYVAGGVLVLFGIMMMLWRVTLGIITGTGSFWIGFLLLVSGIVTIAAGAAQRRKTAGTIRG